MPDVNHNLHVYEIETASVKNQDMIQTLQNMMLWSGAVEPNAHPIFLFSTASTAPD